MQYLHGPAANRRPAQVQILSILYHHVVNVRLIDHHHRQSGMVQACRSDLGCRTGFLWGFLDHDRHRLLYVGCHHLYGLGLCDSASGHAVGPPDEVEGEAISHHCSFYGCLVSGPAVLCCCCTKLVLTLYPARVH